MMTSYVQQIQITAMVVLISLQDRAALLPVLLPVMCISECIMELWIYGILTKSGFADLNIVFIPGDEVSVVLGGSTDDTPLYDHASYLLNGFNGFKI